MPKYVITIQQVIDVEADNEKFAKRLARENPPRRAFFGAGPDGRYDLRAHKSIKIVSCEERGKGEYFCPYCGTRVNAYRVPVQSIDDGNTPPDDIVAFCEKCDKQVFPLRKATKHA